MNCHNWENTVYSFVCSVFVLPFIKVNSNEWVFPDIFHISLCGRAEYSIVTGSLDYARYVKQSRKCKCLTYVV